MGLSVLRRVVAPQPVVGPGRGAPQGLVLHYRSVPQQRRLRAVVLEPLVRPQPDAVAEAVHLVVPVRSRIRSVSDLKGKRVSLGNERSGSDVIAGEILAAYGVGRVKIVRETVEISGGLLRESKIDAFFFLGSAPDVLIARYLSATQTWPAVCKF